MSTFLLDIFVSLLLGLCILKQSLSLLSLYGRKDPRLVMKNIFLKCPLVRKEKGKQ